MNFNKNSSLIPFLILKKQENDLINAVVSRSSIKFFEKYPDEISLKAFLARITESEILLANKTKNKKNLDFWMEIKKNIFVIFKYEGLSEILKNIIFFYTYSIHGNFSIKHYVIAKKCVEYSLNRLLSPINLPYVNSKYSTKKLNRRIIIEGNIKAIQDVAKTCTIVALPTHFSNLDSGIIFWALAKIGLPPFIYGAGLNLFSTKFWNYILSRVGTYKIDRQKKNSIYITVLMLYMEEAIIRGCHSLFYPHGTRSRTGNISKEIKKGLLFAVLKAQEEILKKHHKRQIVFLPIVLNYPFVIEAHLLSKKCLIDELNLKIEENVIKKNKAFSFFQKIITTKNIIFKKSYLRIRFGPILDVLGNNFIISNNINKKSTDLEDIKKVVDNRDYYASNEHISSLETKLFNIYNKHTTILASQLIAYCGSFIFKRFSRNNILQSIRKNNYSNLIITIDDFLKVFIPIVKATKHMGKNGICYVEERIKKEKPIDILIKAINEIGVYHSIKPLYINRDNHITTQSLELLFYYGNRLKNFENEFKLYIQ